MNIGIDKISFFAPDMYIDLIELAKKRNVDPNKYIIGIGQSEQVVIPPTQDSVTMGANAAYKILNNNDLNEIDMIIFATESGVDNSKSSAVYIQNLLNINKFCRTIEIKQACYSGTYGLMIAKEHIKSNPKSKVLIIASDIARYGLETPGEVTQGGGAVAMLITAEPKILKINDDSQYMSEDIMDFWRPLYKSEALVNGHFSKDIYRKFFRDLWDRYKKKEEKDIESIEAFVFHLPYTKQGFKALNDILFEASEGKQKKLINEFNNSIIFNKKIGNLYTGSLYLSLLSLLYNSNTLQSNDNIGLFSYGSGSEGEIFTGTLMKNYKKYLNADYMEIYFNKREKISIKEYENYFNSIITNDNNIKLNIQRDKSKFVLTGINNYERQYIIKNV